MTWLEFAAAYLLFLGAHAVPARPPVRRRLVAMLGERAYLLAYAVLSLALLAWLIGAASRAPYLALWEPAPWQRWVPNLAMPLALLLVGLAAGAPNPFSFGGARPERFDPDRPGVVGLTRHPILLALALWAGAHLVPNGDLAHVLLFGGFALLAVAGMAALDRRRRRDWGTATWRARARNTALLPGPRAVRPWPEPRRTVALRLLLTAAAYLAALHLHPLLFGPSPLPIL